MEANSRGRGRPCTNGGRGGVIADERPRRGECDLPSLTRRRKLAPLADDRGSMSLRTSGVEGEWTRWRGIVSYLQDNLGSSKLCVDVVSCGIFCIFFRLKYF